MTTIIVTDENNEIDEHDFAPEIRSITIGRRSTNDVCVPNLSVSGSHAKISLGEAGSKAGSMIEDLSSTNGTYINGRLISRQLLNDGDDIVLGKVRITFLQPDAVNPTPDDNYGEDSADNEIPLTLAEKARLQIPTSRAAAKSGPAKPVSRPEIAITPTPAVREGEPVMLDDEWNNEVFKGDLDDDFDPAEYGYNEGDTSVATPQRPETVEDLIKVQHEPAATSSTSQKTNHGPNNVAVASARASADDANVTHILDEPLPVTTAVIEIKNGAKSGQVLPIDKPVTTLGRPGIQIAAIMKKPEGYFLMHIESDDNVEPPRLNSHIIGDEPVLLHSGDDLNVAGINVQFMQS